jgi:hypothetical protein
MAQPPVYPVRRPRPTQLTPYVGYLAEHWTQGCHNASRLDRELVQRGSRGSAGMVRVVVRPWRTRQQGSPPALRPAQFSRLILQLAGRWTEGEQETLEAFLRVNPRLAQGYELKSRFQTLLAERDLPALEPWLQAAETSELPSFRSVAQSFRQDADAITAALTTPWSTGPCEGQICRVKLIKRLGYGRAKLDLLRQRIWHRVVTPMTRAGRDHQVHPPVAAYGSTTTGRAWRPRAETYTQPTHASSKARMNHVSLDNQHRSCGAAGAASPQRRGSHQRRWQWRVASRALGRRPGESSVGAQASKRSDTKVYRHVPV